MEGVERTCMTQGCLGRQKDASFEGPMILREHFLLGTYNVNWISRNATSESLLKLCFLDPDP